MVVLQGIAKCPGQREKRFPSRVVCIELDRGELSLLASATLRGATATKRHSLPYFRGLEGISTGMSALSEAGSEYIKGDPASQNICESLLQSLLARSV